MTMQYWKVTYEVQYVMTNEWLPSETSELTSAEQARRIYHTLANEGSARNVKLLTTGPINWVEVTP